MGNKIWLSVHSRNFGSHVTIHVRLSVCLSAPQGYQCEMQYFPKCGSLWQKAGKGVGGRGLCLTVRSCLNYKL